MRLPFSQLVDSSPVWADPNSTRTANEANGCAAFRSVCVWSGLFVAPELVSTIASEDDMGIRLLNKLVRQARTLGFKVPKP